MNVWSVTDRLKLVFVVGFFCGALKRGKNLFPRSRSHTCSALARRVLLELLHLILSLVSLVFSPSDVVVLCFLNFCNSRGYPPTAGNKSDNPATAEEHFKIAQDSRQRNACLTYAKGGIRLVFN